VREQVPESPWGPIPEGLHAREGLARIDAQFLGHLQQLSADLHSRLLAARAAPAALDRGEASILMLALGAPLEDFLLQCFDLAPELRASRSRHADFEAIYRVKWKFVRRQALLGVAPQALEGFDADGARKTLLSAIAAQTTSSAATSGALATTAAGTSSGTSAATDRLKAPREVFDEADFARAVLAWQADPAQADLLELARLYSAWAASTPAGQALHADSILFRLPAGHDPAAQAASLPREQPTGLPQAVIRIHPRSPRLGPADAAFALTDAGTDTAGALDQTRYCLICHRNGTDSCSRGLDAQHTGCPLGERISEFHALRNEGLPIAALAMITRDNPMVAATGHRICNDCVQACVFQSQTPVDIPQAETQTLREVLALPWGIEVYDLLTRWNPLNFHRPLPRPDSGRKVLVVGAGPAGMTLAHHLLQDGHTVVMVDALRIEPLPEALRDLRAPLREAALFEGSLQERTPSGFGGVAEYGITVRWNKHRLDLLRLLLERRERFSLIGGVRLGSNLGVQDALDLGFDHVALAVGAGRPHLPDWPQSLVQGVRTASDFLMALQLEGTAREDSLAALQLRLPAVVVGGGLTALDTATELQAWYVVQVLRFAGRHRALVALQGMQAATAHWTAQDHETAETFLAHAQAIEAEQARAQAAGQTPDLKPLLRSWGGVTVLYRRSLAESPAWRTNPAEVMHALDEGISFAEGVQPTHFETDHHGAVAAVCAGAQRWPARSVLLALGTQPNTGLADDEPGLRRDGLWFALQGEATFPVLLADPPQADPDRCRRLSVFGDAHPQGAGSVVKAMASAQKGWPVISNELAQREARSGLAAADFIATVQQALSAHVVSVIELAPGIVQVVVRAPLAAQRFQPGQFFRLQTFEQDAPRVQTQGLSLRLAMEGLALTGSSSDPEAGTITMVVLEMGGSSDLCRGLKPGQAVVLMGPTGEPTDIVPRQTVVLAGGGLGNAVLLPIGAALRAAGCRVLYFAAYRNPQDVFHRRALEAAADMVVWCCEAAPGIAPERPQDRAFTGNVVQALQAWQAGAPLLCSNGSAEPAGPNGRAMRTIRFEEVDRLLVIGSDRMMAAVARARQDSLGDSLGRPEVAALASVNSPMQCMMKGICGQCVQWLTDPVSGQTRAVFTCAEQDQPLDWVRFDHLAARLGQNHLAEQQNRILLRCTISGVGR
jgi:NADPH-dependent glutamate synthase beta subunit-like oxidoreductase/NAD(P)H-flavin reductase